MLSKKKIELLELLGRLEVSYSRDLAVLLGCKEFTANRKRLEALVRDGFVVENWRNGKKIFYLSQAGLSEIDSHMKKPYNPKGYTTDHALYIAEFAAYIHLKTMISLDSFIFDREMEFIEELKPLRIYATKSNKDKEKVHAPDFVIGNRCYEVELNAKSKARLKENFLRNSEHFKMQVWLIPTRLNSLKISIKKLSEEYHCAAQVISLEEIEEFISLTDIKINSIGRHVDLELKDKKHVVFEDVLKEFD